MSTGVSDAHLMFRKELGALVDNGMNAYGLMKLMG